MKLATPKPLLPILTLALASVCSSAAFASTPPHKRPKSDKDINAIGRRNIALAQNWYSLEKEKELGAQLSAAFERSVAILQDPAANAYVEALTQRIAQNSDAHMPVTVRIVNRDDVSATTVPGGNIYVTRGLLLQLKSEGELASILAREVAHIALRSATWELTRRNLLQLSEVPLVWPTGGGRTQPANADTQGLGSSLTLLHFRRIDEADADYFGVQYLYKSGYDTDCFLSAIQKAPPQDSSPPIAEAFSPFPLLPERLKALTNEIAEILPKRSGAIVLTLEFNQFQEHLRGLEPPKPEPKKPMLLRDSPPI